jgi:general secretion pathway protein K
MKKFVCTMPEKASGLWPVLAACYSVSVKNASAPTADQHAEDGFVLVAVIWMAGLLAVISTAFVLTVRSHTLIARNLVYNGKAETIADGMVKLAALRLVGQATGGTIKFNGEHSFCQWSSDAMIGLAVQDQGGLVDLNVASPDLLNALFKGLAQSQAETDSLIAELQDYRDPDSQSASGESEPSNYPGKNFGPKNAPFSIVEELDQVPGVNAALFEKLLPLVTVQSQQPGFDLSRAPKELLAALGATSPTDPQLQRFSSPSAYKLFAVDVVVETKQNARYYRHAMIALVLQPDRPFAILSWQQGRNTDDWQFPETAQSPCIN